MRVMITGCLGTIGRRLAPAMAAAGHEVDGVDLRHAADIDGLATYQRADVADYRETRRALSKTEPELVFHLAAEFGRLNGEDYYEQVWRSNVIGTRNILEIQREMDFKHIFASSSEVYGELDEDLLSEDADVHFSLRQHNDYAISKWVNERQIMNFEERYGTAIMRLRFFNAYGFEDYHPYRSVVCLFAHDALARKPLRVYRGYHRTFMHMDDFIPTLVRAVDRFYPGEVINVGGREYRPVEDVARIALGAAGRDPDLDENYIWVGEDAHNVRSKRPDIAKAEKMLGHDPVVVLEDGVPSTVEWMSTRMRP